MLVHGKETKILVLEQTQTLALQITIYLISFLAEHLDMHMNPDHCM